MSRTSIHKTTHLHRMAFAGESIYKPNEPIIEASEVKVQKGCRIAGAIFRTAEDPEEQDYLNGVITPALLGSAWQDAFVDDIVTGENDLMYRVIQLPRLDIDRRSDNFAESVWLAGVVHIEEAGKDQPFVYSNVKIDGHIISIMRTRRSHESLGTGSLWLGAAPVARRVEEGFTTVPEAIQYQVRESGYRMTKTTIGLARKIGALPTINQLNDAYSPLTVEFMRTSPGHLRDTYREAFETSVAA